MSRQTIIALVLVAAIAISIFLWYRSQGGDMALDVASEPASVANAETIEFRKLLHELRALKLDTAFFDDPVYKSLVDPNVLISKPAAYGRPNPFIPYGFETPVKTTTKK